VGRGDAAIDRRTADLIAQGADISSTPDVNARLAARGAAAVLVNALGLAAALLAAAALSALGLTGSTWHEGRGALVQILIAAASLAPMLVALRATRDGPRSVGLTRANLGRSVAIGTALAAAWLLGSGTLGELRRPRLEHAFVLIAALSVGFSEEIVSRGYMQSRLIAWIGTSRGIILAAAIFALLHLPQRVLTGVGGVELLQQVGAVALLGAAFGVLQASTRNVALPGIVHTAIDWSGRFAGAGN
jgi:membrane protease YdiL (CAAX protease family)